jgi:hypothetical protein
MAKFQGELPNDLIKELEIINKDADKIFGEMVSEGAKVVYKLVKSNMASAFKTTKSLNKGLKITKVYKTPSDDGINAHVGFYGYDTDKTSKAYPKGTPIPLIAMAREYGTSRGEKKKPFFRKSFKKKEIEQAMMQVQDKYIKGD